MAAEIAANSPLAVQGTKAVLTAGEDRSVADGLDYVATWNAGLLGSDDLDRGHDRLRGEATSALHRPLRPSSRAVARSGHAPQISGLAVARSSASASTPPALAEALSLLGVARFHLGQHIRTDGVDDVLGLVEQGGGLVVGDSGMGSSAGSTREPWAQPTSASRAAYGRAVVRALPGASGARSRLQNLATSPES